MKFDENPPAPPHARYDEDDRDHVLLGPRSMPAADYEVTKVLTPCTSIHASPGSTLDEVIALSLIHYHVEYRVDDVGDHAVWHGEKLVALIRCMELGRREVLVFEGRKVSRRIYPPNRFWLEDRDKRRATQS